MVNQFMLTVFIDQRHQAFINIEGGQVVIANLNLSIDQGGTDAIDVVFFHAEFRDILKAPIILFA
jgi:hypothetical protein